MNTTALLSKDIIPGRQISDFQLGDPIAMHEQLLQQENYEYWSMVAAYPRHVIYSLADSLSVTVNIFTGKICAVTASGDYPGRLEGGIGIGSTISSLLDIRRDVRFDMEWIIVGDYDLIIRVDNDDDTIYNLDQVRDNKIIEITIEDRTLF